MLFQYFPYSTSSATGGPPVLTRSQRPRQQEAEGPLQLHEEFVADPTASVGNEGSSAVFEGVCRFPHICELNLKGLHVANHTQPMAVDIENVCVVVLKPSTSTGTGETTGKGHATGTHEVGAHPAPCTPDAY